MTFWPKCCDLRLCGLRFCERRIGSALDPCAEVCALRAARCTLRSEDQDCLRHGLRAASGAVRAAIVPRCCNLRAAACDWPTARGLRLADCGSQIRMQSDSPVHSPGHNDATCNVRRAVCDVADGGLSAEAQSAARRDHRLSRLSLLDSSTGWYL